MRQIISFNIHKTILKCLKINIESIFDFIEHLTSLIQLRANLIENKKISVKLEYQRKRGKQINISSTFSFIYIPSSISSTSTRFNFNFSFQFFIYSFISFEREIRRAASSQHLFNSRQTFLKTLHWQQIALPPSLLRN